jgi:hypothetical protein
LVWLAEWFRVNLSLIWTQFIPWTTNTKKDLSIRIHVFS